jgi:hypothetical protein
LGFYPLFTIIMNFKWYSGGSVKSGFINSGLSSGSNIKLVPGENSWKADKQPGLVKVKLCPKFRKNHEKNVQKSQFYRCLRNSNEYQGPP